MLASAYDRYLRYLERAKKNALATAKASEDREYIAKVYTPMSLVALEEFLEKMPPQHKANFQEEIDRQLAPNATAQKR